jgi:hypothetical protein
MTALLTLSGFKAFAERRAHYLRNWHTAPFINETQWVTGRVCCWG